VGLLEGTDILAEWFPQNGAGNKKPPAREAPGALKGVNHANANHFTASFPLPRKINRSVSSPLRLLTRCVSEPR
jgi:hypothetical protein